MKSEEFATALSSPSSPHRGGVRGGLKEFATAMKALFGWAKEVGNKHRNEILI